MKTTKKPLINAYTYLKNTKLDKVIVRRTHVQGGPDDVAIDATCAGFSTICYFDTEVNADCYEFTRRRN